MQIHRCERRDYLRCRFVSNSHWLVADICYRLRYFRRAYHGRTLLPISVTDCAISHGTSWQVSVTDICYRLRYLRTAHHGRSLLQISVRDCAIFARHIMAGLCYRYLLQIALSSKGTSWQVSVTDICYRLRYLRTAQQGRSLLRISVTDSAIFARHIMAGL